MDKLTFEEIEKLGNIAVKKAIKENEEINMLLKCKGKKGKGK